MLNVAETHSLSPSLSFSSLSPSLSFSSLSPSPESLYFPLKDNEPFKHLITLFSELVDLRVFSYTLYLSTLIARGDTALPIIPSLPFFRGEGYNPPPSSPTLSEPGELSLAIPLSLIPKYDRGGGPGKREQEKKKPLLLEAKQEERTMSPSLPPSFDQRESLLASLGDYGSSSFGHEMAIKVHACTCNKLLYVHVHLLLICYSFMYMHVHLHVLSAGLQHRVHTCACMYVLYMCTACVCMYLGHSISYVPEF